MLYGRSGMDGVSLFTSRLKWLFISKAHRVLVWFFYFLSSILCRFHGHCCARSYECDERTDGTAIVWDYYFRKKNPKNKISGLMRTHPSCILCIIWQIKLRSSFNPILLPLYPVIKPIRLGSFGVRSILRQPIGLDVLMLENDVIKKPDVIFWVRLTSTKVTVSATSSSSKALLVYLFFTFEAPLLLLLVLLFTVK